MIGLIMGPQGAGKGTQAKLIQHEFKIRHVSTGDFLRAESAQDTERGRMIKHTIENGDLVPNDITNKLAEEVVEVNPNVLFDGYPRDLEQAEYMLENFGVDFVIMLELGEEESVKRLGKRRICSSTGKIYIIDDIKPEDIEECQSANGRIITRDDDKPEAIKHRLKIYHEETEPLLQFYRENRVKILKVNGEQSVDDVFKDIKELLKPILEKHR